MKNTPLIIGCIAVAIQVVLVFICLELHHSLGQIQNDLKAQKERLELSVRQAEEIRLLLQQTKRQVDQNGWDVYGTVCQTCPDGTALDRREMLKLSDWFCRKYFAINYQQPYLSYQQLLNLPSTYERS